MFDLTIVNGQLFDGTGAPPRFADIGIIGETIVEVAEPGQLSQSSERTIDASGKIVTPGFVDIHTHYDAQVSWDSWITPSSWHGVTTAVMGSCGVGFAPVAPTDHEKLIFLMEGVEDIPGSAMTEGITWGWETFPEFLDTVESRPFILDIGTQVPHSAVRVYVMGERGIKNEDATPEDLEKITEIVEEGLRAGALGVSTTRTLMHRAPDGEYAPGTFAVEEELYAIGDALVSAGHGVFQFAPEHTNVPHEFPWMMELARKTGHKISFNFSQSDADPDLWKQNVALLEQAHNEGLPIYGQVAGRPVGILMCWEATVHPFMFHPAWGLYALLEGEEKRKALQKPEVMEQFFAEESTAESGLMLSLTSKWERMFIMPEDVIDYEPAPEDSVAAHAQREGKEPRQVAWEALCRLDGRGMLYYPLFNYSYGDLNMLEELHQHPGTRMGLADAGAHVATICDGGTPTFMLAFWGRDRKRGEKLPLEFLIHRQTQQTAELFDLKDRGVIAPGYRADINVIDFENLGFSQPEMAYDLPGGAKRLVQRGRGYVATICRGVVTVENDEFTGELPGKLIRGPQEAKVLASA